MNIHDDKTLYKLIAAIALTFSTAFLGLAFAAGGLKGLLFAGWIIFAFLIFAGVLAFSLFEKGLLSSSPEFSKRSAWGLVDFHKFRFSAGALALLFGILTFSIWEYLDKKFPDAPPDKNIPVSQIPSPFGKK